MTRLFELRPGDSPLLVSVPHAGTHLPPDLRAAMTPEALWLPDTDWYVDRLYDFAAGLGAGMLTATHSRYVVDLNRPPDDGPLYATRATGLVPTETFDGEPLYAEGAPLPPEEALERVVRYWRPFHDALHSELERIRARHGHAVLLDAHSIRSRVPLLFDGRLPDLNLGTHDGASAAPGLVDAAMKVLESAPGASVVLDGRFKGGYITRHYGDPAAGVHTLQLEIAQAWYMNESPPNFDKSRADRARSVLAGFIVALRDWEP